MIAPCISFAVTTKKGLREIIFRYRVVVLSDVRFFNVFRASLQ